MNPSIDMSAAAHRRATSKHIAVLAFPFGTHAAPLLSLVSRLSEAAPDVRFSFFSTAKSNASTSSIGDHRVKRFDVGDGLPEGYVFRPGNQLEVVELFLNGAAERFKEGMEAAEAEIGEEIGGLISDAFFWFGGEMAAEMEVPWVALWTSGPRPLLVHLETDLIRQNIKADESKDKSLDFLPGCSAMRVADLAEEVISASLDSPFPNMLHKMGLHLPKYATSVLINSFEEIDPQIHNALNSKLPNYLNIGPLNLLPPPPPPPSDDHSCLPWLDNHPPNSVVYISFGGFLTPPPHELAALAEALQETEIPFLWSFRGNAEENLPRGLLEKGHGKIVPWAPQVQVLKHASVGAFVTHGGWNSVLESVGGGVAMIGRPFMGDQRMNVTTVENVWGIGVGLDGGVVTKNGILTALGRVLGNEDGKLMREKLEILQDLACKATAEFSGSSSRNFSRLVEILTHSI